MFTDRFNLNTKFLWPNFRFKDACTSRLKMSLRLCQGRVCVSCHWTLQCLCRGCFRVPFEDVSTSQSGTFQRLNYIMNRTYSLSYLHLLVRSSWKDAFTSGTHLRLGPDWSWLLMPWLLVSPGHQQPWYWLCRIGRSLSYISKDFNHLCHVNVGQWHEM